MHNYGPTGVQNFSDQMGYKVQLFIQCRKLKDVDGLGQGYSDPICFIYHKVDPLQQNWQLFGRTEEMKDNLNPDFEKSFLINYYFEKHQPLRFEVMDGDNSGGKLQLIGATETTLGQIMGSKNQTFIQDLLVTGHHNSRGKIIVRGDSVKDSNWEVTMKVGARNLISTKSFLCCSDNNPFFEIYRASGQDKNQFYKVYDSHPAMNTLNPVYQPFKISGQQLCNSDKNTPIQFKFINRAGTQNLYIGTVTLTVQELLDRKEFEIKNSQNNQTAGFLSIHQFSLVEKPSFIDYLRSGWQINLQVAIDFTASNGEPSQPNSLHYLGQFNQYEQAIQAVGSILEAYDNDKSFPVFGFGGVPRFLGINNVSHCFPLNGNWQNPEVVGVQGLLSAYRTNLPLISLSGPTYFSYILGQITEIIKMRLQEPLYNILLIITDGEIHDMEAARDQIVAASHLPLSIIIVGVGQEKFKLMKQLDSDDALLRDSKGITALRDIVQFVKFKKFVQQGPQRLAEEVLAEVPDQLVSYMLSKGVRVNHIQFNQNY